MYFSSFWGSLVSWAINTFCQNTAIAFCFGPSEIFLRLFLAHFIVAKGTYLLRVNVFHKIGINISFCLWHSLNLSNSIWEEQQAVKETTAFRKWSYLISNLHNKHSPFISGNVIDILPWPRSLPLKLLGYWLKGQGFKLPLLGPWATPLTHSTPGPLYHGWPCTLIPAS